MAKTVELKAYRIGDADTRPWGGYVVTAVSSDADGNDIAEKTITVNPKQMLSLQSHEGRAVETFDIPHIIARIATYKNLMESLKKD